MVQAWTVKLTQASQCSKAGENASAGVRTVAEMCFMKPGCIVGRQEMEGLWLNYPLLIKHY